MDEPVEIDVEGNPNDAVGKEYPYHSNAARKEIVHDDKEGGKD